RRPPTYIPFPYTTLFRSQAGRDGEGHPRQLGLLVADLYRPQRAADVKPVVLLAALAALTLVRAAVAGSPAITTVYPVARPQGLRSEEHTSELQSPYELVC